jgi:hypothetical protein
LKTEFDNFVTDFGDYSSLLPYFLKAGIPYNEAQVCEDVATDKY